MNKTLAKLNALCLINAQDVITRLYAESDKEIEKRFGSEENGLNIAMRYVELAEKANRIFLLGQLPVTMSISQPDNDGNRIVKKYEFTDAGNKTESIKE